MKIRITIIAAITLLLTACNFSLAEDITPPPNYVPPTPMPTLVLYPSRPPGVANGAAIYVEKCLPCHGETGLGDGEQGIKLGVTVRAFGLAEIARPASPAQYYTMVTRGNIERFMPPFQSLTDQERWDVIAYVLTMHTTPEEIEKGKAIFEAKCAGCSTKYFEDQVTMSTLSEVELARIVRQGNDQVRAFGSDLSDAELWAVAAYLRSFSYDTSPLATPQPVAVNETPVPGGAAPVGTSQASSVGNEANSIPHPGFGSVSGSIENKTDTKLPSNLKVTLRGLEHDAANPNAGPLGIISLDGVVNTDGTYRFENVEMPTSRIFVAEVTYKGLAQQSGFAVVAEGAQSLNLPVLTLYESTDDFTKLSMDDMQVIIDYGSDALQVYGLYSFHNTTDKIITIPVGANSEIPFITFPKGTSGVGFEPTQDSEKFIPTENGFAIPPSENPYGLVAFSSLPNNVELKFSQSFVLPVPRITVYAPEGMKAENSDMADLGIQTIQNFKYQIYEATGVVAGGKLDFTLTGKPQEASSTTGLNHGLLLGGAALGIVLILAGLWMYRRDVSRKTDGDEGGDDFESAEEVMDAIIALDDLHSLKKIPEKAYQKRRAELKEILKELMQPT